MRADDKRLVLFTMSDSFYDNAQHYNIPKCIIFHTHQPIEFSNESLSVCRLLLLIVMMFFIIT